MSRVVAAAHPCAAKISSAASRMWPRPSFPFVRLRPVLAVDGTCTNWYGEPYSDRRFLVNDSSRGCCIAPRAALRARHAVTDGGASSVIAGAFAWLDSDHTTFNAQWGLRQFPAGSGQVYTGTSSSSGCKLVAGL